VVDGDKDRKKDEDDLQEVFEVSTSSSMSSFPTINSRSFIKKAVATNNNNNVKFVWSEDETILFYRVF